MEVNREHIRALLFEKVTGAISEEDDRLVTAAIENDAAVADMWNHIRQELDNDKGRRFIAGIDETRGWDRVKPQLQTHAKIVPVRRWRIAAAVISLIIAAGGVWYFSGRSSSTGQQPLPLAKNTLQLRLSDGKEIPLPSSAGNTITAGTMKLVINGNGLTYTAPENTTDEWATLMVPGKLDYKIVLKDGTEVWLNSLSSLRFPYAFRGGNREVYLSGEAYFKVAKNEQQPFIVHTNRADVHVLGTHFNINAYNDEGVLKTTLLEGAVRLSAATASVLLAPGEQGLITGSRPGIEKKRVNVNQEIAWKAGYFVFRNNTIGDIMRQISRWYDVEITYRGGLPTGTFGGTYSKGKDLPELLNGLELTGLVHFKIEGRNVIVMP